MSNNKQGFAARPNLSAAKKANGTSAASSTNKLAFAGTGTVVTEDEKSQLNELRERERAHLERISLLEDENEKFK